MTVVDEELRKSTEEFMGIPEPARSKYSKEVIRAIANSLEVVMNVQPKLRQAKMMKDLVADLKKKKNELLPVMYYVIKPEFRETVVELLERFSGIAEKKVEEQLGTTQ